MGFCEGILGMILFDAFFKLYNFKVYRSQTLRFFSLIFAL